VLSFRADSGTALPLVLVFILIMFILAGAASFQTSGVRRIQSKAHLGFLALEVALSAMDEAAAIVAPPATDAATGKAATDRLFVPGVFGTVEEFLASIRDNKVPRGVAPDKVEFREITYGSSKSEKLFSALTFDPSPLVIPMESSLSFTHYKSRVPLKRLSSVVVTPLRFRREHYTQSPRWVNWGVVQLKVAVELEEAGASVCRVVTADRLFRLRARKPDTGSSVFWSLEISRDSQKTVIRGSRNKEDPV